jgi:tRNA 5-methylaminomethyl-2-thiouridine biosynthesis bifunctional protein
LPPERILADAQQVFMQGCGLPAAWAGQPQWRVLETGFGLGLNFLVTWQAWRADPARPRLLHFVSCEAFPASAADVLLAAQAHPELIPLAAQLAAQWQGLLPGLHRLSFEDGQVLLTLGIGDAKAMLQAQSLTVDSVYLDGFSPQRNPDIWDLHTLKAVARCCRRGTRLATWTVARSVTDALTHCGFEFAKMPGVAPKRDQLQAVFNPRWEPQKPADAPAHATREASRCVVIGAGLAGAACAASLARRGWQVTVLDALAFAAGGASALPAGLMAPHVSPDDSALSRLSRRGLRATWQTVKDQLAEGQDWSACGVRQRRFDSSGALPADWPDAGQYWSRAAEPMPGAEASGFTELWHAAGGWVKPARLVQALLASPGITERYGIQVGGLRPSVLPSKDGWQVLNEKGECVAEAPLVVLAAGFDSARMLSQTAGAASAASPLPLQAIRGQVAWGPVPEDAVMPGFAVNGHGNFIPAFPVAGQERLHWLMGATFERDNTSAQVQPEDQAAVLARLERLLPATAVSLQPAFAGGQAKAWAGVRCAAPDHLPLVGPLDEVALPGLQVCTALGSRGLSLALLCGELLAAWLHAEPLPVEQRLARAMRANRFQK